MKLFLVNILLISGHCYAQISNPQSQSLGNCTLLNSAVFSASNSPAMLALNKELIGACLSNRFGISKLSRIDLALHISRGLSHIGISYGIRTWARRPDHFASISFATGFGEQLFAGVAILYQGNSDTENPGQMLAGHAGAIYKINEELQLAAQIELRQSSDLDPTMLIRVAANYQLNEHILWSSEILTGRDRLLNWRLGIRLPAGKHELLIGYYPGGSSLSMGLKIHSNPKIVCSAQYHPVLGISPAISIIRSHE